MPMAANTVIISNGFAAMGIGLPGAIAAKLAQPERRVVAITNDKGLLMNIQELETAIRLGLSFVVLIFRDDGYGVIRWKQERQFGHTAGVDFGNPDFVALARAAERGQGARARPRGRAPGDGARADR